MAEQQSTEKPPNVKVFLIDQGTLKEAGGWPPVLSNGDAYLIDTGDVIYAWLGNKCTPDEKETAAVEAQNFDKERNGNAKIVTYDQGDEGADLMKLINGFRVVTANKARTFLIDVTTGSYAGHMDHVDTLYRVSREEFGDINTMKFFEVPFEEASLDSEDCFIADKGDAIYVWQGNTCNIQEKVKAMQWARKFDVDRAGAQKVTVFREDDPEDNKKFRALAFSAAHDLSRDDAVGALDQTDEAGAGQAERAQEREKERAEREAKQRETQAQLEAAAAEEAGTRAELKEKALDRLEDMVSTLREIRDLFKGHAGSTGTSSPSAGARSDAPSGGPEPTGPTGSGDASAEKRLVCPKCGSKMVHKVEDKSNVLMYQVNTPIYGKKNKCGQCGHTWK